MVRLDAPSRAEDASAALSSLSLLSTARRTFGILNDFRRSLNEFQPHMITLFSEIEDIIKLIANIEAFFKDYKDRAIAHKIAEFRNMYQDLDVEPSLERATLLHRDRLLLIPTPQSLKIARQLKTKVEAIHQRPKTWAAEIVDSGGGRQTHRIQRAHTKHTVPEVVILQKDRGPGRVRSSSHEHALFGFILQKPILEDLAANLQRPACGLKIWKVQFGSQQNGVEAIEPGVGPAMRSKVKTLAIRLRRTTRLRARSTNRRPFKQNAESHGLFAPGETTLVLYHAPIALSRNEEDWSLLGAVCPERNRAVTLVSNNSYFNEAPEDLQTLKDIPFVNKEDVEIGPFLILVELIKMLTKKDALEVTRHAANVYDIERRLRLFVPDESNHSSTGIEIDFPFVTATLSSAISRLSFHQMRLEGNLKAIKGLTVQVPTHFDCIKSHRGFLPSCEEVKDSIENWLTDIRFNLGIARVQLQVANAMISQRDARESVRLTESSMRIAEAAKSDSSVMKMLSLLGAFFLPGTFVSALFSMGIFNWQADPGEPVVSSYFWIYWAITAPLTVLVASLASTYVSRKSPASQRKKPRLSLPRVPKPVMFQGNRTWTDKSGSARDNFDDDHRGVIRRIGAARAEQQSDIETGSR